MQQSSHFSKDQFSADSLKEHAFGDDFDHFFSRFLLFSVFSNDNLNLSASQL